MGQSSLKVGGEKNFLSLHFFRHNPSVISFVSDVHIRHPKDEASQLFFQFLRHPKTLASKKVYLLGDIFDFMVGKHAPYLREYEEIFEEIKNLLNSHIEVHFVEGNHDFHLEELMRQAFSHLRSSFFYHKGPFLTEVPGGKILSFHGDEIDAGAYRWFIRSCPAKALIDALPYKVLRAAGQMASRSSRSYSGQFPPQRAKEKFRQQAQKVAQSYGARWVVCGHGHVKDLMALSGGGSYANNGHFPVEKVFTHFDGKELSFVDL